VFTRSVLVIGGMFVAGIELVMSGVVGAMPLSFLLHPVAAKAHPKIPIAKKIFFIVVIVQYMVASADRTAASSTVEFGGPTGVGRLCACRILMSNTASESGTN